MTQDSTRHHDIVPNGYNVGRDWLVKRAITGSNWQGLLWKADVEWREGLLNPGNQGFSDCLTVGTPYSSFVVLGVNHGISQDGRVAILTVHSLPPPPSRFPSILLKYFGFPSHHVSAITALFANFVHVFLMSLYDL
jgi:hypothetical protein